MHIHSTADDVAYKMKQLSIIKAAL